MMITNVLQVGNGLKKYKCLIPHTLNNEYAGEVCQHLAISSYIP